MNRAIFKTREIYSKVGVGVGRVKWFAIPVSLADGPAGRLIACRSTGEPVFAGELRLEGDRAFALSAVARPGAFPLTVEGALATAALAIREVVSGPVVVAKQQPVPIDMTSR